MGKLPKAAHSPVFKTRLRALKTELYLGGLFIHGIFFSSFLITGNNTFLFIWNFDLSWGKSVLTQIYRNPPFCFIPPFLLAMHDIQA